MRSSMRICREQHVGQHVVAGFTSCYLKDKTRLKGSLDFTSPRPLSLVWILCLVCCVVVGAMYMGVVVCLCVSVVQSHISLIHLDYKQTMCMLFENEFGVNAM